MIDESFVNYLWRLSHNGALDTFSHVGKLDEIELLIKQGVLEEVERVQKSYGLEMRIRFTMTWRGILQRSISSA